MQRPRTHTSAVCALLLLWQVACNVYLLSSYFRDARIGYRDPATIARHSAMKRDMQQRSRECCVPGPFLGGIDMPIQQMPVAPLETEEELLSRRKAILERARRKVDDEIP